QVEEKEDRADPEITITADALDNWLGGGMGARWGRCSPEGGSENEDNKHVHLELTASSATRSGGSSPTPSTNTKEKKKKDKHKEKVN
ncbi:Protein of unknown function, partial [Gryllus bimaculatus]